MRRRRQRGFGEDALDGRVRALAGRAAGAIGDRDEVRLERREPRDRLPQRLFHLLGLRREELERDADAALVAGSSCPFARIGWRGSRPASRHLPRRGARRTMRGSRPSHSETAILPSERRLRRQVASAARRRDPAAFIHCATVSAAKPSRRWACSSRRNSRSCGAKSTTSNRPPGRSTRAASWIARAPSSRKCSTWWTMTTSNVSFGSARS